MTLRRLAIPLLCAVLGCGHDPEPAATDFEHADAGTPAEDIAVRLASIPGVTVSEQPSPRPGYRYLVVHVTQMVNHAKPGGQTFQQELSLMHKDLDSPLVFETTGYDDFFGSHLSEPALLLGANQVSIEHRFFGGSVPSPADWSLLNIQQMADDEHEIVTLFKRIYRGKTLATGASKGGMTAVFFARFHPGDVDGTVPYVAPLSFGDDPRYVTYLDDLGTVDCQRALRAVAAEMLQHRRAALLAFAQAQATSNHYAYNRVQIGPALESAIDSLEWSFWQYTGISACGQVPTVTAPDLQLWSFLDQISPVTGSDDTSVAELAPYYYQAAAQLGFPGSETYLDSYLQYKASDYAAAYPVQTLPQLDLGAMQDIDQWVQSQGNRLLFLYGQWDPWSGGMYRLGNATESAIFVHAQGSHESQLRDLAPADKAAAYAMLAAWTGVQPVDAVVPQPPVPQRRLSLKRMSH